MLAACSAGGGIPHEDDSGHDVPTPAAESATRSATDCVTGEWVLDGDDMAQQLLQYMIAQGAPMTEADSDGDVGLTVDGDGTMSYSSGITYTLTAHTSGIDIVVEQSQSGLSTGDWGWEGSSDTRMTFTGWVNGIEFRTIATAGGNTVAVPVTLPEDSPGSVPLTVSCAGDTLTTKADPSPFTSTWHRQ